MAILEKCKLHGHQWGQWCPYEDSQDGFWYVRHCQLSGCDAKERAEDLTVVGRSDFTDTRATEKALEEHQKLYGAK